MFNDLLFFVSVLDSIHIIYYEVMSISLNGVTVLLKNI